MQFHPTTLAPTGVLITEGCRGEGAYLLNSEGDRFLKHYAPNAMELASRDVISRAEQTEIDEGRGVDGNVLLDLRHLGAERDPRAAARDARALDGVHGRRPDLRADPGAARALTTTWAASTRTSGAARQLEGLYAAGECACVSVHGANRLGGNALMETITFGKRAGAHAAEWALSNTTVEVPESLEADAERELRELLDRSRGRAALVDPGRARRDDARELRRVPPRGADAAAGRDRRLAARAVRARRRRGQGRRVQQRPDAGARARLPARARGLHGRRRPRAQGEPRRARAAVRLSRARRRELHAAHARHLAGRAAEARTGSR